MKLRTKIIVGFGIVLMLLITIGVVSLLQIGSASRGFTNYRGLARDTNLAGRLQANMLMVRMNVKDFLITGSDHDYNQYTDYIEKMNGFLEESQTEIQKPERAELIDQVDETVTEYEEAFERVYLYRAQRDDIVNNHLLTQGVIMEHSLSEILVSAEADEDMSAAYIASLSLKHMLLARLYMTKFLDTNDDSTMKRVQEEFGKLEDNLVILDRELQNPQRRKYLADVQRSKAVYVEKSNSLFQIILDRNDIIDNTLDVHGPEIASWVEEVKLSIKTDQDALGPKLQAANDRSNLIIWIILAVASISGIVIAMYTITSVLKQLGGDPSEIQTIAEKIASGDLRNDSSVNEDNAIGVFASMVQMQKKLREIVELSLTGTEQIAAASGQIAAGNQDLSNRTEQQATALEETSSAIEEMNSSIRSNADNTGSADQLSRDALDKTNDGSEAVSTMITSMNEISVSSTRIADIIEVINNIAFQTNLLALNASIEAARAGEQGKGFAVVAVEVRKLAKRSDKAATEIAEIIKNSNKKVDEGVEIANIAGTTLTEINGAVKKVTALVGEISAASQEQLSSVDQIDKTLSSLDENTQKNAALVEEAASSTEELSAQAQELFTTMQFFKLDRMSNVNIKSLRNKSTGVALVEDTRVERVGAPANSNDKSGTYETFSNMADESDFSEF